MNMNAITLHDVLSYEEFHEKKSEFIKVAGKVELHPAELEWLYNRKQYIVQYRSIYEIIYSHIYRGGYYTILLYKAENALTKRGRFKYYSASEVNDMLGFKLLNISKGTNMINRRPTKREPPMKVFCIFVI